MIHTRPLQLRINFSVVPTPMQIADWRCDQADERVARARAELAAALNEQRASLQHWNDVRYGGAR